MTVGVVDIGTNSMRLLITGSEGELGRWVEVTGLGRGVDSTGALSDDAMARTLTVFARFARLMDEAGVSTRAAMATSATRDARNREEFLARSTEALGVRPEVISGEREGRLAYAGATSDLAAGRSYVISDIGGGSSEFVTAASSVSIDIGSVRLTDRLLPDRPATSQQMRAATSHVHDLFEGIEATGDLIGVAGTWTSLAAIDLELDVYDRVRVHHHRLEIDSMHRLTAWLAGMTVVETSAIPSLDPGRAPVILAGAVVATAALETVGAPSALVSERDTLDGRAMELLDVGVLP